MSVITNPQNFNICFTIASLLLIFVTLIINSSEELYNNRQKRIFGMIIFDALIMNIAGLVHNLWIYSDHFREVISYETTCDIVILEKIATYFVAYLSMRYIMSIFRVDADTSFKKVIIFLPFLYSLLFWITGLFSDIFYTFDELGEIVYRYPLGASVNICPILYLLFAIYLYIKYARSFSTEKVVALIIYLLIMMGGIPVRIITKSSSIFEFSVSLGLLLCVYTFQNPSEFKDSLSGAGTKNALNFAISNNIIQKKVFTVVGVAVERLALITAGERIEVVAELLSQITSYLKQMCPEGNIFYIEDGHYILIFPEAESDDSVIEKSAERIRKRFKETWVMDGKEIKLFQGIYAIGFPDEVDTLEKFNEVRDVIKKTHLKQNRDILRVTDLNLKHVEHDKKIDSIVKRALDDGLLEVYYQPIYSPATGRFSSCEALLRLRDPHLGFISPAVFMPVAERNGKVIEIDSFVLSSVCDMIANSEAVGAGLEYVEVNLSVVDCIQTNLADKVIKTLGKYGVKSEQINLEITETFEEGMNSVMEENINVLIDHGLSFSMDDFGTGYSNISRIATLPVEIFKLDKSIVQSAFEQETSYMVMLNLVKIIKSLGRRIVAEGVETKEQAEQIIRLGCDHIQGFYYSRPLPREQFIEFLRENNFKENIANEEV